jgi:hypothetical protein
MINFQFSSYLLEQVGFILSKYIPRYYFILLERKHNQMEILKNSGNIKEYKIFKWFDSMIYIYKIMP